MKGVLRTAATAIACLLTLSTASFSQEKTTEAEYGNIVVYLETASWGQNTPYNKLCFTAKGAQAKTGCVPTAYAILMQYHKWPASAQEKKVYHSGTGESITLGHEYDWENMLPAYSGTYSDAEADAVATLMRDLGWAYEVDYGTGSTQSGAGGEGAAKLVNIFKYKSESPNIQGAQYGTVRDVVANDKLWIEYIKQSLDAGCPIPYSSTTTSGGRHIFILDGYTDKGYFHFNWGWGGQGNGWFKLDDMTPDASSNYSKSHRAYFMLKPAKSEHTVTVSVNDPEAGSANVNDAESVVIADGGTAILSATANEGYTFTYWTLDGKNIGTSSSLTVTVTSDAEYVANFEKIGDSVVPSEVTIKVESTTGGSAEVNGKNEVTVSVGTNITLLATPDDGYTFIEWRTGSEVVSKNASFYTTAQIDKVYTAIFEENGSNVTIEVKGSGGYAYIGDGTDRKVEVKKGSTVFIRATAAEGTGKKFAYWSTGNTVASGKGVILTNKNPYEFVAVENTSFYVNFVTEDTDLNVTIGVATTTGGRAAIYGETQQSIPLGSEIVFEAKADSGYRFVEWVDGTESLSTEALYTTVARKAMTLTAVFEVISTGIENVKDGSGGINATYDLQGRRAANPAKGIHIINDKKTLIK